eukprot:1888367-Prymnesium_polylepis.1
MYDAEIASSCQGTVSGPSGLGRARAAVWKGTAAAGRRQCFCRCLGAARRAVEGAGGDGADDHGVHEP